jgi:hypothetical protein
MVLRAVGWSSTTRMLGIAGSSQLNETQQASELRTYLLVDLTVAKPPSIISNPSTSIWTIRDLP